MSFYKWTTCLMHGLERSAGKAEGEGAGPRRRWSIRAWGAAAALMVLPLAVGLVTGEVGWDVADFAFLGAMLVVACGTYELASRVAPHSSYRAAVGVALVAALILIWMNLAVGIIGTEENPLNLMYGGVLAVGIVGTVIALGRSHGMARAMVATALAQLLVAVAAQIAGHFTWILTGFFAALWLLAAWLFREAARLQGTD